MSFAQLNWPGLTSLNTLIIHVDRNDFGIKSTPIEYSGRTFIPKQEAHITVLGSDLGTHLQQLFTNNSLVEQQVKRAFESTDWSYTKTHDLRHLVRKNAELTGMNNTEESIIMRLKMGGMAEFYAKLKKLGLIRKDQPVPPPHVTLYTRNCDAGIGVHSESELTSLTCELIDQPLKAVITGIQSHKHRHTDIKP
jgi:hypothetical protein